MVCRMQKVDAGMNHGPLFHGLPKNLQRISKESQSPRYDRLAIALPKHRCFHPLSSLLYLRSPAGAVPAGGALLHMIPASHNLCHALLVATQISIYLLLSVPCKLLYSLTGSCRLLCHCASHAPLFFGLRLSTRAGRACISDAPI